MQAVLDIQQINYGELPDRGQLWIGPIGQDPLINQITIFEDYEGTKPILGRRHLDFNGRPINDRGQIFSPYVNQSYSINWTDKKGVPLFKKAIDVEVEGQDSGSRVIDESGDFSVDATQFDAVFVFDSATDITITLNESLDIGFTVSFIQKGAGVGNFAASGTDSILSFGGALSSGGENSSCTAIKISETEWMLVGNIA